MPIPTYAAWMLEQEARAMLTRLARVKPFMLQESMLPAASLLPAAQVGIEEYLTAGRRHLKALVENFLLWVRSPESENADSAEAQRRLSILRLRFNAVITQFDMFDNVITQRSESETGIWLSGLDIVSADAMTIPCGYYSAPPIICYLDRGIGASIRRARTRLPGGGSSPVGIIKVPRERMIGTGIASSLIHEVGHQVAALLDLVPSLRPVLHTLSMQRQSEAAGWRLWERWISEVVADLWSVGRVGITSTMGLMGVVSLPRAFVFRLNVDDPHPTPWLRVKLSAAIGKVLHPQTGWDQLQDLWNSYYPIEGITGEQRNLLLLLERLIPELVDVLVKHKPVALKGLTIAEAMETEQVRPSRLRGLMAAWRRRPEPMYRVRPIVVFAALGQARADGKLTPEEESTLLGKLLTQWAMWSTLQAAKAVQPAVSGPCKCQVRTTQENQSTKTRSSLWRIL